MPTEGWIVKIGRRTHLETIESEFAADNGCFLEIHAGRLLCGDQFDKGTTMFGHDDALAARRSGGNFDEASFSFAH